MKFPVNQFCNEVFLNVLSIRPSITCVSWVDKSSLLNVWIIYKTSSKWWTKQSNPRLQIQSSRQDQATHKDKLFSILEGLTINAGHPSIEVAASWKRTCRKGIWKEIDRITFRDTPSNKRINTLEPIKTTFVCLNLRNLTTIRMTLGIINNQKEKKTV